jgi:hypothetical protein
MATSKKTTTKKTTEEPIFYERPKAITEAIANHFERPSAVDDGAGLWSLLTTLKMTSTRTTKKDGTALTRPVLEVTENGLTRSFRAWCENEGMGSQDLDLGAFLASTSKCPDNQTANDWHNWRSGNGNPYGNVATIREWRPTVTAAQQADIPNLPGVWNDLADAYSVAQEDGHKKPATVAKTSVENTYGLEAETRSNTPSGGSWERVCAELVTLCAEVTACDVGSKVRRGVTEALAYLSPDGTTTAEVQAMRNVALFILEDCDAIAKAGN